ncbi:uncharacterized protein LOC125940167 [Dermacentor silvarum]|uniref:uncharacterized protein LOC125940167 n=1 Tax=Dermacentor silvarum TaxID=543639 RepID=UPI002100E33E|nr:uncharacterized protein LOC125940167 [Dermacentor silvarum]XP_049511893.1 uncharacterized protein LOC125940167 [Dermacentor silvarum]
MEPSRKECNCKICPECQKKIRAKLPGWLQEQPGLKELEEQKRLSQEAGEAGFPGAALLVTKSSAAADRMLASALGFRQDSSESESSESSQKTETSDVGTGRASPGDPPSQEGEASSSESSGQAEGKEPKPGPFTTTGSEGAELPRDCP